MKINLLYDYPQYDLMLDMVKEEMEQRGYLCSCTRERHKPDLSCGCSLAIMGNPLTKGSRPRFFMEHGCSITKRQNYDMPIDYFLAFSQNWADWVQQEMDELYRNRFKILVAGYPRIDYLLGMQKDKGMFKHAICEVYNLVMDKPLVTYFPTYRQIRSDGYEFRAMNARNVKMSEVYAALEKDYNVFVAPHYMENWEKNPEIPKERIIFFDNEERTEFLVASDCVISDTSGIVYESCALDKPIVLIGNSEYPNYFKIGMNGSGRELFLNAGQRMVSLNTLSVVVNLSIKESWRKEGRRKYWAEKAIGRTDGLATKSVVDAIEKGLELYVG